MKITIDREQLLDPLNRVSGVVERRQTLPILSNMYIGLERGSEGERGRLVITGTDLEVEVTETVNDVKGSPGAVTVTARKLIDICRTLPEGAGISVTADGGKFVLKSAKSRFTLHTLPAEDFPTIDTETWSERVRIPQGELRAMLEKTAFAMAHQDVRYYLNGLLLELSGDRMCAVATDGHRLAKSVLTLGEAAGEYRQVIVPRKTVLELIRLLGETGEAVLQLSHNHVRVDLGNTVCTSKLIDGRFPDYEAVLSPSLTKVLEVDRAQLADCLHRVGVLTNEKHRGVRLTIEPERLAVTANNPEQDEASDEIPVAYEGDKLEIGFNVTYLTEALRAIGGDVVEVRLRDSNSSMTLQEPGEDTIYLVMPIRL